MITETCMEMFRRLEAEYFEIAYKNVGYFAAETAARSYRKELRKEWSYLADRMPDETALKTMAERHGYSLPETRAERPLGGGLKPGPECWAKNAINDFENIRGKVRDSLHGDKSETNRKKQLEKAVRSAASFVAIKPCFYDVKRHGKWISETMFEYMVNYCRETVRRYAAVSAAVPVG